eukprot:Gb_39807 [translate_table: standard]
MDSQRCDTAIPSTTKLRLVINPSNGGALGNGGILGIVGTGGVGGSGGRFGIRGAAGGVFACKSLLLPMIVCTFKPSDISAVIGVICKIITEKRATIGINAVGTNCTLNAMAINM